MSEILIDTRGQKCPIPVLKLEKQLENSKGSEIIILLSDDPIAKIDIPLYCKKNAHKCESSNEGTHFIFNIKKSKT